MEKQLKKALNKAMVALRELRDVIACPPDMKYEDCVCMYAADIIDQIEEILEGVNND